MSAAAPADSTGLPSLPRTLVERRPATVDAVLPERPFDHVAVMPVNVDGDGARIRFLTESGTGEWRNVPAGDHGPDRSARGTGHRGEGALVHAPAGAVGYQVEVPGGDAVETAAISTREGERVTMSGEEEDVLPIEGGALLRYVTRSGWGADESLRHGDDGKEVWPGEHHPVQLFTVHHAAMPVADDPRETMRAIYQLHAVENGWGDIGYHLLIDPEGIVYEGRVAGGTLPVFESAPLPGSAKSVTAAHAVGYNSGNIGICMLGDYTSRMPPQAAIDRLVEVVRSLALVTGVNLGDGLRYVNPVTDKARESEPVAMHRDWGGTACPGDAFAERFTVEVRDRAASAL